MGYWSHWNPIFLTSTNPTQDLESRRHLHGNPGILDVVDKYFVALYNDSDSGNIPNLPAYIKDLLVLVVIFLARVLLLYDVGQ